MSHPAIRLVVSDIDGTLITSNHELTGATRMVASRLRESGVTLTLASSRPPRSIVPFAGELDIQAPFAAFNGATIAGIDGGIITQTTLPSSVAARIKSIADKLGLDLWLYDDFEWYAPNFNAFVQREEHSSGFSPKLDGYQDRLKKSLSKLTVVGKPDIVAEAEGIVMSELAAEVAASRSKPRFLDITAYGMHKGAAVTRLAEILNVSPSEVAVIGDGPNDLEMFRQAGVSIAMGQGVDEVRALAKFTTSSNDEDGWARGIEKHVLANTQ